MFNKYGKLVVLSTVFSLASISIAQASPTLAPVAAPQSIAQENLSTTNPTLTDGIYLYGETAQPEQIGKNYVVFEVRKGRMIGAFFMPRSSFDCAFGIANGNQLNVTVINSYDQKKYPFTLHLNKLQRLPNLSANDQRILKACTQIYQQQVWKN